MKTYARGHRQAPARRSDADTGEGARERFESAPVPRRAPSSDPAAALLAALRWRNPEPAGETSAGARLAALQPVAARPLPPVLATGFPRIAAEVLLRSDPETPSQETEPPAPENAGEEREPAAAEKARAEGPRPKTEPRPEPETQPEPRQEPERPEGKAKPPGKAETPTPRGPQEFGRVAAGGNPRVPGPVVFERPPPLPAGQAFRPGDVPPEGEGPPARLDERVKAEEERFERVAAAEPLAEKREQGPEEPEPSAVSEPAGAPRPQMDQGAQAGAAPPAPPAGPPAAESKGVAPETPAKEKEAEALQARAEAEVAKATKDAETPAEPQSVKDVQALVAEGEPEAAAAAEPAAPAPGPAAELEQWQARAGAAAGNIPEPDLGPPETRTEGMSGHAEETAEAQKQRREELAEEARKVIKSGARDIGELDQVPEALAKDDPVSAVEAVKQAAKRDGLPAQSLPNLQPTPKGYLPNLYGDPITPAELAELREQYKDKLLPKDRQPPGYDEIAALRAALEADPELQGRIVVFGGQQISGFELPPKVEIAPLHQADIAAVLARIVTEAGGLGKTWIEDARKAAYTGGAMVKEDAFPDLGNDWAPQEAEFLLGEMQRVADAAGIGKEKLDQAIGERQQQLAGDGAATQRKGEEVFKDSRDKVAAEFQNTQGAIEGLRQEWDDWADAQAAKIKGNVDPKAVRARQRELEKAVCDMANEWIVAYDDMAKQRARKLLQAAADQEKAYRAAIAKDRGEDLEAAGEDAAKRKQVEDSKAYGEWVEARMKPVKDKIHGKDGYLQANAKTVGGWQKDMRGVRDGVLEQLQQWGDRQIGRERGWIDWILSRAGEWRTGQRSEAEAFARQRARETTEALGTSLQFLNDAKGRFGETLEEDEKAQLKGLGAEQQAVIDTYYAEQGGGDAIGAVAAGLKIRLRGQRLPELAKALRAKVLETPTNEPGGMRLVSLVKGTGEPDPVAIAVACRSGFEHTWGTNEDTIFGALGKVRSKEGGKAVRAAYWNQYTPREDFDARLKDELAGGALDDEEEYDKAKAQLEFNKIDLAAADLRIAVEEWGTNEEKINEVLRGLDEEQRKAVVDAYERKYGESLKARLESELSGYDKDITFALYDGNKEKADAIELKQAQNAFWGPDKEKMEKVYQRLSDEEWDKGRSEELPAAEIEKNIKARKGKLGEEYRKEFKTGIDEDFKKTFQLMGQPVYADLMIGLQQSDWKKVDAARVEIERNPAYSLYAEDKTINEKVLKAQYDRAYKNLLYDAELALQKEERKWMEANPDKPWNADYRRRRQQELAEKASTAAQAESQKSMNDLRAYYMKTYGGGGAPEQFDEIIKDLTQGTGEDEAVERLKSGGYLPPDREIFYAVEGAGTDEDRLKGTLKGKTKYEIQAIREAWEKANPPPPTFDERILDELSGRDEFDVGMMLKYGEPTNPEDALKLAKEKLAYEGRTGGIQQTESGPVKSERYRDLELQTEQLEKDARAYREARKTYGEATTDLETGVVYDHPQIAAYQNSWMSALAGFNDTVDIHRQEVDATADLISGIVAMVVAVVVGALLAPFTAGQSLWLIAGAAALVAAASTAATMLVKYSIKGDAYFGDDMTMDLLFGGVDVLVSAATAGVGGKILKAGLQGGKTATEGAKKGFRETLKEGLKRAGTKEAEKQFAHTVLTETAQGMFSTVAVPAFMDEYGKGMNPLANMVLSMGLSMGSGIALAKGINGLSRLRPADFDFEAAARSSGQKSALVDIRHNPEKLGAMRSAYLEANPHKTPKDFLKDYDDLLLKQMKDGEVKAKWQHEARTDMLQYVPQEHKARFAETPIEMLSEQEFLKRTRSKKGEAFVEMKDGKPTVFVKQGASETALRREAPHLLQSVDEKWQGHLKDLDEGNLRNWHAKDTREKFRLYGRKLDVEIDAALQDLDLMRGQARKADAPASLAREIEEVEETLRNLAKRRHEAGNIGPLRRTLMAWGGSLFEPQYLKQEPRLFSKTSTGKYKKRFGPKIDFDKEADILNDYYPQSGMKASVAGLKDPVHFQVHTASGASGPSSTYLRAIDPANPSHPAPVVFVRKHNSVEFELVDNTKLKLPPEPDGHVYRTNGSGDIELVPSNKHKGPYFELGEGGTIRKLEEAEAKPWDPDPAKHYDVDAAGNAKLKPGEPASGKHGLAADTLAPTRKFDSFENMLDGLDLPGKGKKPGDPVTAEELSGLVDRGVLRRVSRAAAMVDGFYGALDDTLDNRSIRDILGLDEARKFEKLLEDMREKVASRTAKARTNGETPTLTKPAYDDFRRTLRDDAADLLARVYALDEPLRAKVAGHLFDKIAGPEGRLKLSGLELRTAGGKGPNKGDLLGAFLLSTQDPRAGKGNLFGAFRERLLPRIQVPDLTPGAPAGSKKTVFVGLERETRVVDIPAHEKRTSAERQADGFLQVRESPATEPKRGVPLKNSGEPPGYYGIDDKAGKGAFKLDQARDYGLAIRHSRETGGQLEGFVYFFDDVRAASTALDDMLHDPLLKSLVRGDPPAFFLGYMDGGQIKWLELPSRPAGP